MYHLEAVHVLQPIRGVGQLVDKLQWLLWDDTITHELDTINPFTLLHVFIDVTVGHPFGYHRELVLSQVYIHTQQR